MSANLNEKNMCKSVADVPEVGGVDVVIRTFSHQYIPLTDEFKQSVIDYLDWLENQGSLTF